MNVFNRQNNKGSEAEKNLGVEQWRGKKNFPLLPFIVDPLILYPW